MIILLCQKLKETYGTIVHNWLLINSQSFFNGPIHYAVRPALQSLPILLLSLQSQRLSFSTFHVTYIEALLRGLCTSQA